MVLLTFIKIVCMVIKYSHLLELIVDNYLTLEHSSDKYVSRFDQFFVLFILFNLKVQ